MKGYRALRRKIDLVCVGVLVGLVALLYVFGKVLGG